MCLLSLDVCQDLRFVSFSSSLFSAKKIFMYVELQIVFMVFTPALLYSSLAETVTLQDIISW